MRCEGGYPSISPTLQERPLEDAGQMSCDSHCFDRRRPAWSIFLGAVRMVRGPYAGCDRLGSLDEPRFSLERIESESGPSNLATEIIAGLVHYLAVN